MQIKKLKKIYIVNLIESKRNIKHKTQNEKQQYLDSIRPKDPPQVLKACYNYYAPVSNNELNNSWQTCEIHPFNNNYFDNNNMIAYNDGYNYLSQQIITPQMPSLFGYTNFDHYGGQMTQIAPIAPIGPIQYSH